MKPLTQWILVPAFLTAIAMVCLNCQDVVQNPPGDVSGKAARVNNGSVFLPVDTGTGGYARATEPGAVRFPADLGPHEDYQTEWWYYTGNLATAEGRRFGYQLTFFRRALSPPGTMDVRLFGWRTNQVYMAHFALSDIGGGRFHHDEAFSRGAMGLAGATADPYAVWLGSWHARAAGPGIVELSARSKDAGIDLRLEQTLPPVLHGDRGLSPKGPEPGNASYYYSIIRQQTTGTVTASGRQYTVTGLSWKDHEYSTSALGPGTVGWDWFSLQFDDGTALMLFQIRREDGSLEDASGGTFIHADGSMHRLEKADWHLAVTDQWKSPRTGAVYPVGWRIRIGPPDLEISGKALMADQEMAMSTTYWEGAAAFTGTRAGRPVTAEGYVEMTGYAETMEGRF